MRKMQIKSTDLSTLKYLSVICLALAAGCADTAQKTTNQPDQPHCTEIKTKDIYIHAPSGMEFPTQVAGFKRVRIISYERDSSNISAEYALESFGFKIAQLIVYIYPIETDPVSGPITLEKHFDEVRALLFNIYADARDLEDGQIKIGQSFGPQTGLMFRFVHRPPDLFKSKLCYAKLCLFKHGPWFIKYRLTNPVKDDVDVEIKFGQFMQLLAWPELTAPEPNQPTIIPPDSNF